MVIFVSPFSFVSAASIAPYAALTIEDEPMIEDEPSVRGFNTEDDTSPDFSLLIPILITIFFETIFIALLSKKSFRENKLTKQNIA